MAGVLKIERRTYHGLQNSECEDVYRGHERQRDHDEDGSVPDQVSPEALLQEDRRRHRQSRSQQEARSGRCHPGFHQGRRGALSYLICNRSPASRQGIVFCLHGLHNSYFCAETQKTGLTIRSTCGTK